MAVEALKQMSPNFAEVMTSHPKRATCEKLGMSQEEIDGKKDEETGSYTKVGPGAVMSFPPREIDAWSAKEHSEERLTRALEVWG